MEDQILDIINHISTPGFFVTIEFTKRAKELPTGIELFVNEKLQLIHNGAKTRKFAFRQEGWNMLFTFFPTDRVVDEKYALKNRVLKQR